MSSLLLDSSNTRVVLQSDDQELVIGHSQATPAVIVYATAAELLADTVADGSIGYAEDTDVHYFRQNGGWEVAGTVTDVLADAAPTATVVGQSAVIGVSTQAAREDHQHRFDASQAVNWTGAHTFGAGIGVTGNIVVSGNVDGRDVSVDGATLDALGVTVTGLSATYTAHLSADLHTMYLKADGTRNLTGNLTVSALVTIDGRDISVDGATLDALGITVTGLSSSLSAHVAASAGVHGVTGSVVGTTDSQTLTNKTLTTPTIASFVNATHNHQNAAGGGQLDHGLALTGLSDDDHPQYFLADGTRDLAAAAIVTWTGRARLRATSSGVVALTKSDDTALTRLLLGPASTGSFGLQPSAFGSGGLIVANFDGTTTGTFAAGTIYSEVSSGSNFVLGAGGSIDWRASGGGGSGSGGDTGIKRISAGLLGITDASSGQGKLRAAGFYLNGTTSSDTYLKFLGSELHVRLGDDSNWTNVKAANFYPNGGVYGLSASGVLLGLGNTAEIRWHASGVYDGTGDVGFKRSTTNTIQVTNGSSGSGNISMNAWTATGLNVMTHSLNFNGGNTTDSALYDFDSGAGSSVVLGLGTTHKRNFIITARPNYQDNYAHVDAGYPQLIIHSVAAAATATDQWMSIAHDGTDARVTSGKGKMKLIPGSAGYVEVTGQVGQSAVTTSTPSGTTQTVDWNNGNFQILTLASATGDVTLTLSNPAPGAAYSLKIIQHASSAKNIVWPATVKWPDGVAPVISTGASAIDVVSLVWDGAAYLANWAPSYA